MRTQNLYQDCKKNEYFAAYVGLSHIVMAVPLLLILWFYMICGCFKDVPCCPTTICYQERTQLNCSYVQASENVKGLSVDGVTWV